MSIKLQRMKKEQFAVCGLINVKEIGPGSTVHQWCLSIKISNMLGKQITAGQLTNSERMTMHKYDMMITMVFNRALRHNT